jgi:predicted Fe-Mo cluster-binding NifX family protein
MKVVVTSQGKDLTSSVDPRFGRAKYFLVVDTEQDTLAVHDNAQNLNLPQGAGIQAGQTVVNLGVEAVITGNVGPKAFTVLQAGKVKIYTGVSGTVKEALAEFKAGKLKEVDNATVEGHWF